MGRDGGQREGTQARRQVKGRHSYDRQEFSPGGGNERQNTARGFPLADREGFSPGGRRGVFPWRHRQGFSPRVVCIFLVSISQCVFDSECVLLLTHSPCF